MISDRLRGVAQYVTISLKISACFVTDLVIDLVTFSFSLTKLIDKDGFTVTSKAVILSMVKWGLDSRFPLACFSRVECHD